MCAEELPRCADSLITNLPLPPSEPTREDLTERKTEETDEP